MGVCVSLFYLISTSNYTRVAASCSSADSQVQQYNVYNETFTNQTLNKTPHPDDDEDDDDYFAFIL